MLADGLTKQKEALRQNVTRGKRLRIIFTSTRLVWAHTPFVLHGVVGAAARQRDLLPQTTVASSQWQGYPSLPSPFHGSLQAGSCRWRALSAWHLACAPMNRGLKKLHLKSQP